jgi:hypothetical protein
VPSCSWKTKSSCAGCSEEGAARDGLLGGDCNPRETTAWAALEGSTRFDLLVTNISSRMGPSGWTLARRARSINPDIQVLYVSGDSAALHEAEGRGTQLDVVQAVRTRSAPADYHHDARRLERVIHSRRFAECLLSTNADTRTTRIPVSYRPLHTPQVVGWYSPAEVRGRSPNSFRMEPTPERTEADIRTKRSWARASTFDSKVRVPAIVIARNNCQCQLSGVTIPPHMARRCRDRGTTPPHSA